MAKKSATGAGKAMVTKAGAASGGTLAAGGAIGFDAAVTEARSLVAQAKAVMVKAGISSITDEERLHSNGKLRQGEPAAMLSVLDAMDTSPGVFEALAPNDHGVDADKVETAPSRGSIARWQTLAPLVADLGELARDIGDDALASASLAKDVTVPAYAILRANAPVNPKLRAAGKGALDFYGGFGLRRTQETKRKATAAKKAAQTPPAK